MTTGFPKGMPRAPSQKDTRTRRALAKLAGQDTSELIGNLGNPGIAFLFDGDGGGDSFVFPGQPGRDGATGAVGPVGAAIFLEAPAGEDGYDGRPGPQGQTGDTGALGPAIFLAAEEGDQGDWGPPGPQGTPGSGASTSDHYLVGQSGENDTDLTNRVVIPGLSGSPDIRVAGTNDSEFDTLWDGTGSVPTPWATFGTALSAKNFNSTAKSNAYLKMTSATAIGGLIMTAPTIPYTMTVKLTDASVYKNNNAIFIFVTDSSTGAGKAGSVGPQYVSGSGGVFLSAFTWTTFSTATGASGIGTGVIGQIPGYLRIIVHAANNVDYQCSWNGTVWFPISNGSAFLASALYCGISMYPNNSDTEAIFDWVRFT